MYMMNEMFDLANINGQSLFGKHRTLVFTELLALSGPDVTIND